MLCERPLFRSGLKSKVYTKVCSAPLAILPHRVKHAHADILEHRPIDATESVPHPLFDRARHLWAAPLAKGGRFGISSWESRIELTNGTMSIGGR